MSGQNYVSYLPVGASYQYWVSCVGLNGGGYDYGRYVTITTNGITFTDNCTPNTTPASVANMYSIPKYIYGISTINF